jgi:hypothetical protein
MIRFLNNIIVLSIVITIGGFIFEIFVRNFFPQFDPSGHVTFKLNKDGVPLSEKRGKFRQIKNTGDYNVLVIISQQGLRESKPLTKAGPKDIFVVGDSFSFGWGVEEQERFSNQLELLLGKAVFNISIPTDFDGYDKLISYAKRNGAKIYNLIIGVTMENDIRPYDTQNKAQAKNNVASTSFLSLLSLKFFLRNNSATYFLITSIIHKHQILKNLGIKFGLIKPNLALVSNHLLKQKDIFNSAKRLKNISKKFNSLILIIPSRALWTGSKQERAVADKYHSLFISEITKLKLQFVDLRAVLEQSGNPMALHFRHDGHWTAEAHNLAAKQLAVKLNSMETRR